MSEWELTDCPGYVPDAAVKEYYLYLRGTEDIDPLTKKIWSAPEDSLIFPQSVSDISDRPQYQQYFLSSVKEMIYCVELEAMWNWASKEQNRLSKAGVRQPFISILISTAIRRAYIVANANSDYLEEQSARHEYILAAEKLAKYLSDDVECAEFKGAFQAVKRNTPLVNLAAIWTTPKRRWIEGFCVQFIVNMRLQFPLTEISQNHAAELGNCLARGACGGTISQKEISKYLKDY